MTKEDRDPGANCPKCMGRGIDRKGRVCGYHKANPTRIAAFCVRQKEEIDRLLADNERMRRALEFIAGLDLHRDKAANAEIITSAVLNAHSALRPEPPPAPDPKPKVHRSLLTHAVYAVDPTKIEDRCVCENCSKTGTMRALLEDPEPCPAMVRRYGANADDSVPKGCTQATTDGQGGENHGS